MKKNFLSVMMAAVMATMTLVGCGEAKTAAEPAEQEAAVEQVVDESADEAQETEKAEAADENTSEPEQDVMEVITEEYTFCYNPVDFMGYNDDANDSTTVSFINEDVQTAGSNFMTVTMHRDTTYDAVLDKVSANSENPEYVMTYFGKDGIVSYVYLPESEASAESGLKVVEAYYAIPCGKDVIEINIFRTVSDDDEVEMRIDSSFEEIMNTFALMNPEDAATDDEGRGDLIPACFLDEKTGKSEYESFDEVIGYLEAEQGYAYVKVAGQEGDVLLVTSGTYDNLDGNMASIDAGVYAEQNGKVVCLGEVFSSGTAYPIACSDGVIYTAGNHNYEEYVISPKSGDLVSRFYITENFDENGNASYIAGQRSDDALDALAKDVEIKDQDEFYGYIDGYCGKQIVNFEVVK